MYTCLECPFLEASVEGEEHAAQRDTLHNPCLVSGDLYLEIICKHFLKNGIFGVPRVSSDNCVLKIEERGFVTFFA